MKTEPTEALKNLIIEVFDAYDSDGHDIENVVDYESAGKVVRSAFEEGQSNPKIKQLEWVEDYGCIMAETPFLKYLVLIIGGKAGLCFDGADEFLKFRTVDEAKAAAQRDFERRVKECLE